MRACGETFGSDGFGIRDHVCWASDDLVPVAVDFLATSMLRDASASLPAWTA